ncbi:4'-phosphopantetheinyl transferase family protein, partial [Acinetobacter baumannii]|uniref:4'-phosphopantetheinyl transferase family protein n=1 Tax=Acinetobacter baumannii TaxID=470 RepID=UPI0011C4CE13
MNTTADADAPLYLGLMSGTSADGIDAALVQFPAGGGCRFVHGLTARWEPVLRARLVALGEGVRLGVDLELLRPRARLLEIVQRFFHPEEVAWLESLDQADREHWFFRVWCAKESMLKAHGQGISFGL